MIVRKCRRGEWEHKQRVMSVMFVVSVVGNRALMGREKWLGSRHFEISGNLWRVQGEWKVQVHENRVQGGLNRVHVDLDRVQVHSDRVQVGLDRV